MAPDLESSGNELQQGSWELAAAPELGPLHSTFMRPRHAYIEAGAACSQGGGGAAAGGGGALLDLAHVGLFGLMESNADNSMFIVSKASDLSVQQSVHYKHGGEERRQLSSAAQPPQPPRRANQQIYSIPTSRQLSRSVPSSPTFITSRIHMNPAMKGGGGNGGTAPGRGNVLPAIARNLSAHMYANQQASSSASELTASLDLASCTSNLVPPSPGSIRSASFGCDHAALATVSSFSSDHKSGGFNTHQAAAARTTNFTSDHAVRSANFGSDQSCAARPANFDSDQAARSASFSSELAAAAALFLPFFPSTPASSTTSLNPTAAEQEHHLQSPSASCTANNVGAKKRRLQGVKSKSSSKLGGDEDRLAATDQDTLTQIMNHSNSGGANVDIANIEPELSNNSANIEGEESKIKGNSSFRSSSTCMKTQVCEGTTPPPKQDYIHVRARRGQATDSHSLAERVRREKISERMKFLQDLVPGCNKITGKAVMLDEIINYVQSLQRQVEFLSMKLSTVSSPQTRKYDASHLVNHAEPKSIQIGTTLPFNQIENHPYLQHDLHLAMPLLLDLKHQDPQHQQRSSDMGAAQAWEDELQSLVQMGFSTLP